MFDRKSRMYLKRVKQFRKIRAACEWGFIIAFVVLTTGFITSIAVFVRNTHPNLTIILLMSGLMIISISCMVTELSRFGEVWTQNKLNKHVHQQAACTELLDKFTIDRHFQATFNQANIAGLQPHLQEKTVSG